MTDNPEITISTFLDGEPVAAAAVLDALDTDAGRAALADFVRLRFIASQSEATPSPAFYVRMRSLAPVIRPRATRSRLWVAAAAVAASLVIGFWTGVSLDSNKTTETGPPRAARVVEFQPGVDWHPELPTQRSR